MPIAIMCSGGDVAGMNSAIKAFVDEVYDRGDEPYFIYDGLEGLIDDHITKASHKDVAGILHIGGTIIGSSRSKRFYDKNHRAKAAKNLKSKNIDKLIVLGGNGSFNALGVFASEHELSFVGIPSTIDNDIFGTDYCLGVDTALNMIMNAIDSIRDTSSSFGRGCVVETMGRDCGYLALVSAIASGAEICLIPEIEYNLDSLALELKSEVANGRRYIVAVVSEATKMSQKLNEWLSNEIGLESRVTVLGHIQRGGNPTVHDRFMASSFVAKALESIYKSKSKDVVVYQKGEFIIKSIDYVNSGRYKIEDRLLKLGAKMSASQCSIN